MSTKFLNILLRKPLIIILLLLSATAVTAQSKKGKRTYTYEAIDRKVEGKVYVQFMIDKKGKIVRDSIIIVRGLGSGLDSLAIDAVKSAPDWTAPNKNMLDKSGHVIYTLPIVFSLSQIPDDEWADYYSEKGYNLIKLNKPDEALAFFQQSLQKRSHNPNALYGMYQAYRIKGDITNANIYLEKAKKKGYKQ